MWGIHLYIGITCPLVLHSRLTYRETMVVGDMGWVDYNFGHSNVCQVLPRQMGVWQNWLGNWAR